MNINVTTEVASAHRNLEELCEKFESSVDEFCASLPQIYPHEFYQNDYIPIVATCVAALSEFHSAYSYEVTAYEDAVAEVGNELSQQKHKLEEKEEQIRRAYADTVAEAENELRQQKRRIEKNADQRRTTCEKEIRAADETYYQRKRELESNAHQRIQDIEREVRRVGVDFTFSEEKTTVKSVSTIPYSQALKRAEQEVERAKRAEQKVGSAKGGGTIGIGILMENLGCFIIPYLIGGFVFFGYRASNVVGSQNPSFTEVFRPVVETFSVFVIIPLIVLIVFFITCSSYSFYTKKEKQKALRALRFPAIAECNIIWKDMEEAVASESASRDRKVKEARSRKETDDKQAAEEEHIAIRSAERDKNAKIKEARGKKEREEQLAAQPEAKVLATHDQKVEKACSRRDQAIAYIKQEYLAFDTRLCQCLEKFQSFIDTWATENAVGALNEIQFQNLNQNVKQVVPRLTRIGSISVWEFSGMAKVSQHGNTDQKKAQFLKPKRTRPKENKQTTQTEKVNTRTFLPGSVRVTPKTPNQDDPE